MEPIIVELKNVSLIYHDPFAETLAIDDLNLTIREGEFAAIVGPSGCGKTSMLNLLCGLTRPSSGEVLLGGNKVTSPGDGIGYMLQHDHLLEWRDVEANIVLGLEVKNMLNEKTRAYALDLLERHGLMEFRHHYPQQLSGGMKKKVALIRTLAFDPTLLLLDEPFSALDYQTRLHISDEVHKIIKQEHKTALLVTHDISEAISMADRVLVFSDRPARVKKEFEIKLNAPDSPIARRQAPEFRGYFDSIWKEIEYREKALQ
ncbi:ABC transporter ATP-binding protein [Eubacteriales bacterium OttesenSCG-928-K08]|nr:ABC transporter ATP-binding protein [Eubacteriales bacterium OttesenSCG-928-K08]